MNKAHIRVKTENGFFRGMTLCWEHAPFTVPCGDESELCTTCLDQLKKMNLRGWTEPWAPPPPKYRRIRSPL